jgi:hypothetical protein
VFRWSLSVVVTSLKARGWRECAPSGEVNTFKVFLGIKLPDLTRKQREEVLDILRGIYAAGVSHRAISFVIAMAPAARLLFGASQRWTYGISRRRG